MTPHFSVLAFIALAFCVDQMNSFPIDDTSTLGLDQGESDSGSLFDEDWSTNPSYELDSGPDMPDNLFDGPETDSIDDPLIDLSNLSPSGEGGADLIATANKCQFNPTQANRLRRGENGDQCFDSPSEEITFDTMMNEQIKRKWCSNLPWAGFGNIPVVRFMDSYIFPLPPEAVPSSSPSSIVPLSGYFNVIRAALRKSIDPALSFQRNEPGSG